MKKNIFSVAIILGLLIGPVGLFAVNAQTTAVTGQTSNPQYTLLEPLPDLSGKGGTVTTVSVRQYIVYVFELAIALAVFFAVVMITWGGFKYMTIESVTGKSDAKEIMWNASLGLLGALGSWLILYTINPQLVNLNLISIPTLGLQYNSNVLNPAEFQAALSTGAGNQQATIGNNLNTSLQQNAADLATLAQAQKNYNDCLTANTKNGTNNDCSGQQASLQAAQNQSNTTKDIAAANQIAKTIADSYNNGINSNDPAVVQAALDNINSAYGSGGNAGGVGPGNLANQNDAAAVAAIVSPVKNLDAVNLENKLTALNLSKQNDGTNFDNQAQFDAAATKAMDTINANTLAAEKSLNPNDPNYQTQLKQYADARANAAGLVQAEKYKPLSSNRGGFGG